MLKVTSQVSLASFSHRWKDEYLILFRIPELSDRGLNSGSGSELDSFNQRRLQGDGELIQRVQDARKGADSSTIPKQSAVLVHPPCQGQLCQEGEPVGEKPVPVVNNRSIISNVPRSHSLHFLLGRTLICEELMLSPSNNLNVVFFQQMGTITPPSEDTSLYKLRDVFSASDPLHRGRLLSCAWRPDPDLHQCSDWIITLHVSDCRGNERTGRKPTPTRRERANATPGDRTQDLSVVRKQRNHRAKFRANKVGKEKLKPRLAGMLFYFSY